MEFSRPAEPTQVFWGAPPRSSLPSAAWVSWALKGFWVLHECVQTAVLCLLDTSVLLAPAFMMLPTVMNTYILFFIFWGVWAG